MGTKKTGPRRKGRQGTHHRGRGGVSTDGRRKSRFPTAQSGEDRCHCEIGVSAVRRFRDSTYLPTNDYTVLAQSFTILKKQFPHGRSLNDTE